MELMELTEITFATDKDQGVRIQGELKGVSISKNTKDLPLLTLTFYAHSLEYIDMEQAELTRFFTLPWPSSGTVRLFGAREMDFSWSIGSLEWSEVTVSLPVKGWHKTYEEACAAEMEEKMVK